MSLDTALTKAQQAIPECVAAGYVDMSTGMLLGVKTVDSHPQEVLDLVAAATADLFQGQSVTAIERMFRKSRGQPENGGHYFREIIVLIVDPSDRRLARLQFSRCVTVGSWSQCL